MKKSLTFFFVLFLFGFIAKSQVNFVKSYNTPAESVIGLINSDNDYVVFTSDSTYGIKYNLIDSIGQMVTSNILPGSQLKHLILKECEQIDSNYVVTFYQPSNNKSYLMRTNGISTLDYVELNGFYGDAYFGNTFSKLMTVINDTAYRYDIQYGGSYILESQINNPGQITYWNGSNCDAIYLTENETYLAYHRNIGFSNDSLFISKYNSTGTEIWNEFIDYYFDGGDDKLIYIDIVPKLDSIRVIYSTMSTGTYMCSITQTGEFNTRLIFPWLMYNKNIKIDFDENQNVYLLDEILKKYNSSIEQQWMVDCISVDCISNMNPFLFVKNGIAFCGGVDDYSTKFGITITNYDGEIDCQYNYQYYGLDNLCMVTYNNNNNLIVCKPVEGIQKYLVYKETTVTDVYTQIGEILYPNLEFVDTNQYINQVKYAVRVINICGDTSLYGNPHVTIHLSASLGLNGDINLDWNEYSGINVSTYRIWRGSLGNLTLIDSVSGSFTNYVDHNAPTNTEYYQIEVLTTPCNSQDNKSTKSVYVSIFSNIINTQSSGINDLQNIECKIYPNPVQDRLFIESEEIINVLIFDLFGNLLVQEAEKSVGITHLSKGIYYLKVESVNGSVIKKFVKM